jgi:hypothetical protein
MGHPRGKGQMQVNLCCSPAASAERDNGPAQAPEWPPTPSPRLQTTQPEHRITPREPWGLPAAPRPPLTA